MMGDTDEAGRTEAIDTAIRLYPWMDFELEACSRWVATVVGAIDASSGPNLRITFRDVAAIALPTEWKTDTGSIVFREFTGPGAIQFNTSHRVERGYTLFEFILEDLDTSCVIAAKSVEFQIIGASPSKVSLVTE